MLKDEILNNTISVLHYCTDCFHLELDLIIGLWKKHKSIKDIIKNTKHKKDTIYSILNTHLTNLYSQSDSIEKLMILKEKSLLKLDLLDNDDLLKKDFENIFESEEFSYKEYTKYAKFLKELINLPLKTQLYTFFWFLKKSIEIIEMKYGLKEIKEKDNVKFLESLRKKIMKFRKCARCNREIKQAYFLQTNNDIKKYSNKNKNFYLEIYNNKKIPLICSDCSNSQFEIKAICPICNKIVLIENLLKCKKCKTILCEDCSLICCDCSSELCSKCIQTCKICKKTYCSNCITNHMNDENEYQEILKEIKNENLVRELNRSNLSIRTKRQILDKFKCS